MDVFFNLPPLRGKIKRFGAKSNCIKDGGKIDIILTKSISRFARNTVDCLHYIRLLREQGIAVIFEKENINTLESDSEILITMMGAFAQAESESISANVRWGKRQAMRDGKASFQYKKLYAFEHGEDGNPKVIPEQAEVVRRIYEQYLSGASLRMIKDSLEADGILNVAGETEWTITAIRGILTSEKYCGDVILQKTFRSDCINRKTIRNTGQLPMYLVRNHHEGIVDRKTYDAVKAEMARRKAAKSPSKKCAPTGLTSYASKYALSERLVCGECGTLYRRCAWARKGQKRVVWRCVSRLDYGTKYCHDSPTLDEEPLKQAILAAVNSVMSNKDDLVRQIASVMEREMIPLPGESMSLADIDRRLQALDQQTQELVMQAARENDAKKYASQLKSIMDETAMLKEKRGFLEEQRRNNAAAARRIDDAATAMERGSAEKLEWDETLIRQLVDTVKVMSAEKIIVYPINEQIHKLHKKSTVLSFWHGQMACNIGLCPCVADKFMQHSNLLIYRYTFAAASKSNRIYIIRKTTGYHLKSRKAWRNQPCFSLQKPKDRRTAPERGKP